MHVIYSLLMFYVNILFQDIGFDPRSSLVRNMALTVGISLSIKKQGLF